MKIYLLVKGDGPPRSVVSYEQNQDADGDKQYDKNNNKSIHWLLITILLIIV